MRKTRWITFSAGVFLIILIRYFSSPIAIYAVGDSTCIWYSTGGSSICKSQSDSCGSGFKPDCNFYDNKTDCEGTRACVTDPANLAVCVWYITGGTSICKTKTSDCQSGFTPDCSTKTTKGDCEGLRACQIAGPPPPQAALEPYNPECSTANTPQGVKTAIGCLPTDPETFVNTALPWAVGLGAGLAFLLGLYGVLLIVVSAGNPEKMQAGRELITSAIAGLVIIVFAVFILDFIGVEVLQLFRL